MEKKELPRLAFFSFTCCEGCQLVVLSCEDELPDILSLVKIVNFREAMDQKSDVYDIAFVEGSITKAEEVRKLKKIRKNARVVVALGACSSTGGLNCLKNRWPMEEVKKEVYGKDALRSELFATLPTRAIDEIIQVDYYLHGCPISKKEFLNLTTSLLLGKRPDTTNHPVCVDCKMAGNTCVFEKDMTCVGPITRAGCDAICVTYGAICWGCRGLVDNPNTDAHAETLKRHGLTADAVMRKFSLYGTCKTRKC
ncbi:MAG: NADH:ubiquinone oxidoreductase [Deltaproteobacteria bacterium GWB2_55_19]|nr:MAG: NADH:ubiquinone oxidoreductase [Deltaproteobacteria bacterium GWB2_55_19]HAO93739.1 NADH:ubiquinone oxidoreductase [Deltaproteobacteria bacterium]